MKSMCYSSLRNHELNSWIEEKINLKIEFIFREKNSKLLSTTKIFDNSTEMKEGFYLYKCWQSTGINQRNCILYEMPENCLIFENDYKFLRPVCTESFRPGLSLKPGLKPESGFKSYVYLKT